MTAFPVVQARLSDYLTRRDAEVWLITGSPQSLVERVYRDTARLPVNIIASRMERRCGGGRRYAVWAMKSGGATGAKIGAPLQLYSGYSDSEQDNPLFIASTAGGSPGRPPPVRIV